MTNTRDLGKFSYIEHEEAARLLRHAHEVDHGESLAIEFNPESGKVFLVDEDYRCFMMNGDKLEEWFNCSYCGHEGFKEDMKHEAQHEDCTECMEELGVLSESELMGAKL